MGDFLFHNLPSGNFHFFCLDTIFFLGKAWQLTSQHFSFTNANFDLITYLQKGNTTSSRSKTRSSPVRTTTELLPKIGPLSNSPPIPQAASSSKDSSSSSASSNNNNSSRLLSKVAAAMPLLPPLPMDIDQAKHAAGNQTRVGHRSSSNSN